MLAHRELGAGPPLLLVNGYASTGADWDPTFLADLSASRRLICPDNPGLGESPVGAGEMTVESVAEALEELLDGLGLERVAVVGWSMGGFAAQALAARAPRRVESLALISTDPGGEGAARAAPEVWGRLVDRSGTPREQAARLIPLLFPEPEAARIAELFGEVVAAARAAMAPATLAAQEGAMLRWHLGPTPGPAPQPPPTVVVHGEADLVIPAANAALLATRWPGAALEVVPGAGHAVMASAPARVAAAVLGSA